MKRRHFYALTILFFCGLIALDSAVLLHPAELRAHLDRVLEANLKAGYRCDTIDVVGLGDVRLGGVTLFRTDAVVGNAAEPVLECREILVSLDWWKLIGGDIEVARVDLQKPVLTMRWDQNGDLDIPSILRSEETKAREQRVPVVAISGMEVAFENAPFLTSDRDTRIGGIDLVLSPRLSRYYRYHVAGAIHDPVFGDFEMDASFGAARVLGTIHRDDFEMSDKVAASLNKPIQKLLEEIHLDGQIDLEVEVSSEDYHDPGKIEILGRADLRDVSVSYTQWPARIENFDGIIRYENQQFTMDGVVFNLQGGRVSVENGLVDLSRRDVEFHIRGDVVSLDIDDSMVKSLSMYPEPGPDIGEVLDAIGADGNVDIDFTLDKKQGVERVDVDFGVTFRQANLCFVGFVGEDGEREGFPYPLSKVVGRVHVDNDSAVFEHISTNRQFPNVRAHGRVDYGGEGVKIDIEVEGDNLRLDSDLRSCLSDSDKELFDSLNPGGPVDFKLNISRPEEPVLATTTLDVTVDLQGCSARIDVFPYDLEDIRGTLVLGGSEGTVVKHVTARHGGSLVEVNGRLDLDTDPAKPAFNLSITADDLALDEDLLRAIDGLQPEVADQIRAFGVKGFVDLSCGINSDNEGAENEFVVTMEAPPGPGPHRRPVSFAHKDFPDLQFNNVRGEVVVTGDKVTLSGLSMLHRNNEFVARGWIEADTGFHDVTLQSRAFTIDEAALELAEALVPGTRKYTSQVHISGMVDLLLHLKKSIHGEGIQSTIDAQGIMVLGKDRPWILEDVVGSISIGADESDLRFSDVVGTIPLAKKSGRPAHGINLAVKEGYVKDGKILFRDVHVVNAILDERLGEMLPESVATVMNDMGLSGSVDLEIKESGIEDGGVWIRGGLVKPTHLSLDPGLEFDLESASIVVDKARFGGDVSATISGVVDHGQVEMGGILLSNFKADFKVTPELMSLEKITCRAIGGRIRDSHVKFPTGQPFDAKVVLESGQLSELLREMGGDPKSLQGIVGGALELSGAMGDTKSYRGSVRLGLDGDKLYELPMIIQVLKIINFDFMPLIGTDRQQGKVVAVIENEEFRLKEASFTGPGINLELDSIGGHVGFDGLCDITFKLEVIKWLDSIPIIGDIVGLGRSIFLRSVRVQGPIEDPNATVGSVIGDILPSDEDSGRRLKVRPLKKSNRKDRP